MDPNATLARIRELTASLLDSDADTGTAASIGDQLAEHVQALDEWLVKGGFLPQAWAENCDFHRQAIDQHIRRRHVEQR